MHCICAKLANDLENTYAYMQTEKTCHVKRLSMGKSSKGAFCITIFPKLL